MSRFELYVGPPPEPPPTKWKVWLSLISITAFVATLAWVLLKG
jgi:hypothetical protein